MQEHKIPDLPCGLNPLKSCQALYHGAENPGSACTQLCLSRQTKLRKRVKIQQLSVKSIVFLKLNSYLLADLQASELFSDRIFYCNS